MDTQNAFHRLSQLLSVGDTSPDLRDFCTLCRSSLAEIPVSTAKDGQFLPWVVDDGEGGVIVMWEDYRTGKDWDVYAQRVDSSGTTHWEENGSRNLHGRIGISGGYE